MGLTAALLCALLAGVLLDIMIMLSTPLLWCVSWPGLKWRCNYVS